MDGLNNPLFDAGLVAAAARWVDEAAGAEAKAGHPFLRYWVGDAPPEGEQRHSAPDIDSGLNAVGMYGALSFIIEAAAYEGAAPAGDLGNRVDAYLVLYRRFLSGGTRRAEDLAAIEHARNRAPPPVSPDELSLGQSGRVGDGVPRRRDRDRARREDPDRRT